MRKDSKPSRNTTMNACNIVPYRLVENDYHFQHLISRIWGSHGLHGSHRCACNPRHLRLKRSYSGLSGIAIARHIWATGLLSFPRPSFGFLKCLPTMSTNGSIVTTTPGSNAYKSFTVTSRGSMYHL